MSNKKKTLIIGASENPERYANKAFHSLTQHGHPVVMLAHKEGKIDEVIIHKGFPNIEELDTVTLYVSPKNQEPYYDYLISLKPKRIIFNPGTENPVLEAKAIHHGIEAIEACTLVLLSIGAY
jgi:predicted CoA-binding protein